MATSWTTADLEALNAAIRTGARRVRYHNREVEHHSLEEMLQLRSLMERELGQRDAPLRKVMAHSKGLRTSIAEPDAFS